MKVLVTSIEFNKKGRDIFGRLDGSRALAITLNTGNTITIDKSTPELLRYTTNNPAGRMTETEQKVARLVYECAWGYLNHEPEETMDMEACSACGELAENRIDWKALGYPDECEEGERYITLADHIDHYMDL